MRGSSVPHPNKRMQHRGALPPDCATMRNPGYKDRHAPGAQASSGIPALLCNDAHRVDVARPRAGSLVLNYLVTGRIDDFRIAPVMSTARADELWRHTCFEAFIRSSQDEGYYEFNFAPSTQWAAYWFSSYRSGMRVATEISAPRIECAVGRRVVRVAGLARLGSGLELAARCRRAPRLSAVLEETSGRKSCWALAHPPGKPDFHRSVCFAHEFSSGTRALALRQ